ncbi:MAG: hypothetical protein LBD99_03375, partial [Candidatus Margulisbacteria bacterium]|nr:hypothetical protein [Candidatus Margulisiibacteriota bacterium]
MINLKKLIPAALLLLLVILGANPLFKLGLEKAGSAAFGAKTEIAGFSLNFLTGRLRLKRLAVANKNAPFANLFEIGQLNLGLDPEQLLYKRVAIESLTIENILLGAPRKTSGALPQKSKKTPEKKPLDLNKLAGDLQINPAAAQNALRVAPPKAGAEAARIQKENELLLNAARKQAEAFDLNKEIAALGLNELGSLNISSAADLQKAQSLLAEKQKGLNKITETLQANQAAAAKALREAQKNLAYLDAAREQDIANLLAALD